MADWDDVLTRLEGPGSQWDDLLSRLEPGSAAPPVASPAPTPSPQPWETPDPFGLLPQGEAGADPASLNAPFPYRAAGRFVAQGVGTGAGIGVGALTSPITGPVGPIAGGAGGSVAAGQGYDALLDAILGTRERPALASVDTAIDAAAGAAGPVLSAVARPALRAISGVSPRIAERVGAAIERARNSAIESGMNRPDIRARMASIDEEAGEAAQEAFTAAQAAGRSVAEAEAAATAAGRQAAQEAARRVWTEAEAAGRAPPKTGRTRRKDPAITAEANAAAERAREEARARILGQQSTGTAGDPEAASVAAAARVRDPQVTALHRELSAEVAGSEGRRVAEVATRAVGSGTARLGDMTALVGGLATGSPMTTALIFGAGRAASAGQRAIARRLLQREDFRKWVQETGPTFGSRGQVLASLGALAATETVDAATRSAARDFRTSIVGAAIRDARDPRREESTGRVRARDGRFLPDLTPDDDDADDGADGRDTGE